MKPNLKTTLQKLQRYLQLNEPVHPNKIFLETEADLKAMIKKLIDIENKQRIDCNRYGGKPAIEIEEILGVDIK